MEQLLGNFSISTMIIAFLFSGVGFVYFSFGKKMAEFWFMISGLALMIYPWFVDGVFPTLLVGCLLCGAPFIAKRYW